MKKTKTALLIITILLLAIALLGILDNFLISESKSTYNHINENVWEDLTTNGSGQLVTYPRPYNVTYECDGKQVIAIKVQQIYESDDYWILKSDFDEEHPSYYIIEDPSWSEIQFDEYLGDGWDTYR